jgi:hypothetical protein
LDPREKRKTTMLATWALVCQGGLLGGRVSDEELTLMRRPSVSAIVADAVDVGVEAAGRIRGCKGEGERV